MTPDSSPFWTKAGFNNTAAFYRRIADPVPTPFVYLIIFPDITPKNTPSTLSLKDSWENFQGNASSGKSGGTFIFSEQQGSQDLLVRASERIISLNQKLGLTSRYFLWMTSLDADIDSIQYVAFNTTGPIGKVVGATTSPSKIQLRNLRFVMDKNVQITHDFIQSSFLFKRPPTPNIQPADIQLVNFKRVNTTIGKIDDGVILPVKAPSAGALSYEISMNVPSGQGTNDLKNLDVGLKYFFEQNHRVISQLYPLFGSPLNNAPVKFHASFDPLHPLQHDLTFFAFSAAGTNEPAVMNSSLRTEFGHRITLAPRRNVSRLVLQSDRQSLHGPIDQQTDLYYLAPMGPFIMSLIELPEPTAERLPQLICGLSAVETVGFNLLTPDGPKGTSITFHPDRPAFAKRFPLEPNGSAQAEAKKLEDRYTTSWVTITSIDGAANTIPAYNSQPEGSWLYAVGKGAGRIDSKFLGHYLTLAASLTSNQSKDSFPLTSYSQVAIDPEARDVFSKDDIRNFEFQIIAPERRNVLLNLPVQTSITSAATQTTLATSPQGFLAEVAGDSSWKRLQLAKTESAGETFFLQFRDLNRKLQNAFQTNQQFLVVTQPKPCWKFAVPPASGNTCTEQTAFDNFIELSDWPFQFNTGTGNIFGDYRNVLIFKFCDGTLIDRIKNPEQWTDAADFNNTADDELNAISEWVQDYISRAEENITNGVDVEYFQNFVDIVNSATWHGVLALRVDINLANFPKELQGLLSGIDLNSFFAHHIGVEVSFINDAGGQLATEGSTSIFGLVYYVDPAFQSQLASGGSENLPIAVPSEVDYYFKVLTLKVLFINSEIKKFASKTQITLNKLFGDVTSRVTTLNGEPISNSIVLNGSYENHNGRNVYIFNTDDDNKFWLDSNIWNYVEITKAQFSTLTNLGTSTNDIRSRFTFYGFLNFKEIDGFDALSFGSEAGQAETDTNKGLSFTNLYLDQQFNLETPGIVNYTFNPDEMAFSTSQSRARVSSLYNKFPINLTGMIRGTAEKLPDKQGYLPVNVGQIRRTALSDSWYGLLFDLNMGTLGALAAEADFNSELIISWSPGSQGTNYRLMIGIRLPGTGSGETKLFSLQGVLRLTIDQIQFFKATTDDGNAAYMLRLTNILLSFLGVKFPPGTSTIFFLFGDTRPGAARDSLGWYAAINRESQ